MRKILLTGLILGALAGCSDSSLPATTNPVPTANSSLPTVGTLPTPTLMIAEDRDLSQVKDPESGRATVIGNVSNPTNNQPYSQVPVQLAEAYDNEKGETNFVLNTAHSPITVADDQGDFVFENIPPHRYVIVVGDVFGNYKVLLGPDQVTMVIDAQSDKKLDLGAIKVDIFAP
ncbi:hypothetical protein [Herpetosiphon llansteffanensis]|uniref:hypothetical protein n=1 Tax=Herpetosiphon llansteffanensis TaxID=2094568 RepID=UPI000D7B97B0|nr:hypothetical protein [Herpetosiphon llansteffanensis]